MAYTVKFFYGTRLDAVNTIDSPNKLYTIATNVWQAPSCDITHIRGLSSFKVSATYEQVRNADFVEASNGTDTAYFSITGDPTPSSPDVMIIPVQIDYLLTRGGIAGLQFTDGLTQRHHVPKSDDTFGAYTEEDPYLVPSKPLEIDDGGLAFSYKAAGSNARYFVESTLDLGSMGEATATEAQTYTDANSTKDVTVPKTIPLSSSQRTVIAVQVPGESSAMDTVTPATCYFDGDNALVEAGIGKCRDLGVEGAILNSWVIPNTFINGSPSTSSKGEVHTIGTLKAQADSGLNFQYATVNNQRVLYGNLNRYIIAAVASGNSVEYNPEDIYHAGDSSPYFVCMIDPRPSGRPYFRSQYFKGSEDFFINCIPGLEWQTAPLVYYAKEGKTIDAFQFNTERIYKRDVYNRNAQYGAEVQAKKELGDWIGAGAQAAQGVGSIAAGYGTGDFQQIGAGIGSAVNAAVFSPVNTAMSRAMYDSEITRNYDVYNITKAKELAQFNLSQSIVEPQMKFPRSESLRDFLGNGIRIWRLRLADSDVTKCDKILTMYGYKDTKPLELTDFTNRTKFNYVQASGVQVIDDSIPKWIREGVAAQLQIGVRVWHVKPDPAAYTDGTNV